MTHRRCLEVGVTDLPLAIPRNDTFAEGQEPATHPSSQGVTRGRLLLCF